VANVSLNLATRSLAERIDIAADLEACRLIHNKKHKGKEWREWVKSELDKLNQPDRVRHFLNSRLGIGN
jgi:hypothetical protein